MTAFTFISGNPANLTGGANADMGDIQGSLKDLGVYVNTLDARITGLGVNIGGRVNADGTVAAGTGFTVQVGGGGTYTLVFAPNIRVTSVAANYASAGAAFAGVYGVTANNASVQMSNSAGVPTNLAFSFVMVGVAT